ncbi:hypothetical protein [Paenibacillus sp. Marseille-Q4541]|uniref:hypothetical protein n=1 Tax=Paenibacillus sp. Marseille-Q4541 TaxID=2831522 RepID=UPI001BA964CC|nr:hypothetical protein [Paenibacillus sp. Marseille-Q4541]
MSKDVKVIIELANDIVTGSLGSYSTNEANDKLREAMNKILGSENGKFNAKKLRRNKLDLFEIIEEAVDQRVEADVRERFKAFVDYRSTAFGDKLEFIPKSTEFLSVSKIAGGTNNLRRQRIGKGEAYRIDTEWYGVKIYEELERFLSGQIDWVDLINDVERAFEERITADIFKAIKDAYNGLSAPYKHTGVWDLEEFNLVVEYVRAATGLKPMVIGTRVAVSKATPAYVSNGMMEQRNSDGFFKEVDGITFGIIEQGFLPGTEQFAIDNDFLLILPNGNEKIVKFVMEGEALIDDAKDSANADDSVEYTLRKKYGVAVEKSAKYGAYILG